MYSHFCREQSECFPKLENLDVLLKLINMVNLVLSQAETWNEIMLISDL